MISFFDTVWSFWIDFWYEIPWFKTGPKLLGVLPTDKADRTRTKAFYSACNKILDLRESLKIPYENPLCLDSLRIASIIDLYAQTVCLRTLADEGIEWGTETLQKAVLAHEELFLDFGKEPENGAQAVQFAISKAMIHHGRASISQFNRPKNHA